MTAPNEAQALQALQTVQSLSGAELEARMDREVGQPVLGVFKALATATSPPGQAELIAEKVHLMVLAYLIRVEVS